MKNKLIKIAIIGKTNSGKSTFLNAVVGEYISIINKKINTTQDMIIGIKNISNTQIIFFDTPGSNISKKNFSIQKKINVSIWESINKVDCILYFINSQKINMKLIQEDLKKLKETKAFIFVVFNKIDLINANNLLPLTNKLNELKYILNFYYISAKYRKGLEKLLQDLVKHSKKNKWLYKDNEISNKDDIFITNECTRNAILKFLHKEVPYNIKIENVQYKILKNKDLKIKQIIKIDNKRYKPIILGKNGLTIKKIREDSQINISKIIKLKVHLYLKVN